MEVAAGRREGGVLLTHLTLSDRTWTDKPRLKGEKRDAFIRRILLGEVAGLEEV
jgi:hypothetical protein